MNEMGAKSAEASKPAEEAKQSAAQETQGEIDEKKRAANQKKKDKKKKAKAAAEESKAATATDDLTEEQRQELAAEAIHKRLANKAAGSKKESKGQAL